MSEQSAEKNGLGLSMPAQGAIPHTRDGRACSGNGRPLDTHDRSCDADLHAEHVDSMCEDCGCCWGCDSDCCSEFICPNADCGCSDKDQPTFVIPTRTD